MWVSAGELHIVYFCGERCDDVRDSGFPDVFPASTSAVLETWLHAIAEDEHCDTEHYWAIVVPWKLHGAAFSSQDFAEEDDDLLQPVRSPCQGFCSMH